MKTIRLMFLFVAISLISVPGKAWAATPGETITATIDQGLKILRDQSLKAPEKMDYRRNKLWDLLEPIFSFEEIAKRSLGRHWLKLNLQQKTEFTELFTKILKDVYLKKSDDYNEGEIIYIREIVKGKRSKVQTNFVKGKKRVVVDFSMRQNSVNWKIYDITIEGVSVLTNYRNQFSSILAKSSFEELMQKLKEKDMEISE